MREAEVLAAVDAYALAEGYDVVQEFPLLGRVADLFGVRRGGDGSIAVECKERDWKRGLKQARTYLAAVDEVYLAVPSRAVTPELTRAAETIGVGVISVDDETVVTVVLSGRRAIVDFPSLRARTLKQFDERRAYRG